MFDLEVIDDPAAATIALEPVRNRLLAELTQPASAATLATRLGMARQKINYHLRSLEAHGLEQGFKHVVLETGDQQPEAIGLYQSSSYARIPKYGEYVDSSYSICFAKDLSTATVKHYAG